MDEAADVLGIDNIELRRMNWVQVGDKMPMAKALGEAREGFDQVIKTNALEECFQQGMAAIGWDGRDEFGGKDLVIDPKRPQRAARHWRWRRACMAQPLPGWTWARPA